MSKAKLLFTTRDGGVGAIVSFKNPKRKMEFRRSNSGGIYIRAWHPGMSRRMALTEAAAEALLYALFVSRKKTTPLQGFKLWPYFKKS